MKYSIKIFSVMAAALLVFAGCQKVKDLPYYGLGNEITLSVSTTSVSPGPADADNPVITFSWTSPNYKTDTSNYKFIVQVDSTSRNFASASVKEVNGVFSTSFTGSELNNFLLNYGFDLGSPYELDVRVVSSYANNNEQYFSNVIKITVVPYGHPATLTSENTAVTGTLATANEHSNKFSWVSAFPGYVGNITYEIEYDLPANDFSSSRSIAAGVNTTEISLTQGQVNDAALAAGIATNATGTVAFRLKATTAQGAVSYSTPVNIEVTTYLPIQKMYLVGNIEGLQNWNIDDPLELINDAKSDRFNKVFYTYVKLSAGAEFKFAKTPGNWSSCYGSNGSSGSGFSTAYDQGGNFSVANAGIYRLTIDIENNLVYIQEKQVGIVGNMQGWTAGSPLTGGYLGRDKFMIIAPSDGTDQFKFHDGFDWDNSTIDKARWWGDAGNGNLNNDGGDPNLVASGTPRTRAIWNGEDKLQLRYELNAANEMRVVGNGIDGVAEWNPGASPQMNYEGNGVWKITLNLLGGKEIKFLAGNDWGAFDYEDNSGGSTDVGSPRSIKWTGGDNFKTPATSGSYTITLNEYNQTVTIE